DSRGRGEGGRGRASGGGRPAGRAPLGAARVALVWRGAPAVLLRVGQAEQPGPAEQAEDLARELLACLEGGDARGELAVGDLADQADEVAGLRRRQEALHAHSCTSSVGIVFSRSTPPPVHTTMSSMRAPNRPARYTPG